MSDAAPAARGVDKPRRPQASPLFRLVSDHLHRLQTVYDDRFAREDGPWRPVFTQVADKFLACGVLEHGFARIRCDACTHEYLLAFSRLPEQYPNAPTTRGDVRRRWPSPRGRRSVPAVTGPPLGTAVQTAHTARPRGGSDAGARSSTLPWPEIARYTQPTPIAIPILTPPSVSRSPAEWFKGTSVISRGAVPRS
jgi:hypothetical protein